MGTDDAADQERASAAHRQEVERFRQRRQHTPITRGRRGGWWVIGLLLVGIAAYATCQALTSHNTGCASAQ